MILFNHFVINVPYNLALELASKDDYLIGKVPILLDERDYDSQTGLIKRKVEGFDAFI